MARRPFSRQSRQASAQPSEEFPDCLGEPSSRLPHQPTDIHGECDHTRDPLVEYQRRRLQASSMHQPRAQFQPGIGQPEMQFAPGGMQTWHPVSQNVHPTPTGMPHVNQSPWKDPNQGAYPFSPMTSANFGHPSSHYHQTRREPVPDDFQLLRQPLHRNNTFEPTTNDSQRLMAHPPQVLQQMPANSTPGSYPAMKASAPQHTNNYTPSNHQGQQAVYSSTYPGQVMKQTALYPPNHVNQLPAALLNYPPATNGNITTARRSTRPTGGFGRQDGPPQHHIDWSGRGGWY